MENWADESKASNNSAFYEMPPARTYAHSNSYEFSLNSPAYKLGLRSIDFSSSHALPWSFSKGPVATLEVDVLAVGNRFSAYREAIFNAYKALPEYVYPNKRCWTETIQHPNGMRDRFHVKIGSPQRFIGLLGSIPVDAQGSTLLTQGECKQVLTNFSLQSGKGR